MTDKSDERAHARPVIARREILRGGVTLSLAVIGGAVLSACGKKSGAPKCDDVQGLSVMEQDQRKTLHYADKAPDPKKQCDNCQQFIPGAPDKCGECKVLKGSVAPAGSCDSWVAKPAT